jgi:hypothetical protein
VLPFVEQLTRKICGKHKVQEYSVNRVRGTKEWKLEGAIWDIHVIGVYKV